MKTNQFIAGTGASLLATELLNQGGVLAPSSINQKLPTQANEEEIIGKNCVLLLQNCLVLQKIAAKIGIEVTNNPVTADTALDTNLLEVKQQLIYQTRSILIDIAKKLCVLIPSLPNAGGSDLVTQNHLLLLGNGLIVWAIALSLGIKIPAAAQLSGSIFEQNQQLLLANQNILKAIACQVGATAAL